MSTVTTPQSRIFVDGGTLVTYQGTPSVCTYWEVVGISGMSEVSPVGSLVEKIVMADANGFAVNQYIGSSDDLDAGKTERIKVKEGA